MFKCLQLFSPLFAISFLVQKIFDFKLRNALKLKLDFSLISTASVTVLTS